MKTVIMITFYQMIVDLYHSG